jgi:hypothetical protein
MLRGQHGYELFATTLLDGKEFADPTRESFLPHIRCLNLRGRLLDLDAARTSAASIPTEAPRDKDMQRARGLTREP